MHPNISVSIRGSGVHVPQTVLTSADLDQRFGREPGFFFRRTGIRQRHVCGSESSSDMAAAAARAALLDADLKAADIDVIIAASAVAEQPIPATAPLVQLKLGLENSGIPAFDVNASCVSFLTAIDLLAPALQSGRYGNALIVSSEIASRALPWHDDPETAAMFGDGAAAAVLSLDRGDGGVLHTAFATYSSGYRDCELPSGGTRFDFRNDAAAFAEGSLFRMDGKRVYRSIARVIEPFIDGLLDKTGWRRTDVDLIIPHQASRGALDHIVQRLGFDKAIVADVIADYGNQIAASLPTALHHARKSPAWEPGARVLLIGTAAGLTLGGVTLIAS